MRHRLFARHRWSALVVPAAFVAIACGPRPAAQVASDTPLSSWNEGPAKRAIVEFVTRTTTDGGHAFVPVPERIAVFDNDGTLWSEQPLYAEFAFVLDRVKALAPKHPDWTGKEPFRSVLANDLRAVAGSGKQGLVDLLLATHTGVSTDEFAAAVTQWTRSAKHPRFNRPYTDLVYQPMLELMDYLRRHAFKVYIVSGGTAEFMRGWTERTYGVPPEQVIGTTFTTTFVPDRNGQPALLRQPHVEFVDDGPGKPVGINRLIGRRPIAAFGNSDGDREMLQWITSGPGPRFGLLVRHTDAEREWAYDRQSQVGRLDKALDEAGPRGWTVVDMKRDWTRVYPFEK